jgi:hypothetical protein
MGNSKQNQTKRKKTSSKTRDGGEQLRTAVEKLVAEQSEKIAQALVDLSGANSPQTKPPKKRRGPTTAQRLAMDKPWEGPEDGEEDLSPQAHETAA